MSRLPRADPERPPRRVPEIPQRSLRTQKQADAPGSVPEHGDAGHSVAYQLRSEKGQPSGYPGLDELGFVDPPIKRIRSGLAADRPASGDFVGDCWWAYNTAALSLWDGSAWQSLAAGGGDPDAIHDNVAAEISVITEKVAPVDADLVVIEDSAAGNVKKRVQLGNLPGGGSVPTGTGFRHVTAGAEDAAAKLVDTADINGDQVTYAKIQNVSATDRLLGRDTAGAGDIEEIPLSTGLEFTGGPGLRVKVADLKVSKSYIFESAAEALAADDLIPQNAIVVPVSGKHGTIVLGIAYARCEVVGAGTNTLLVETSTTLTGARTTRGTINLGTAREASSSDMAFTVSDGMYIWVRCSAVNATAPQKVTVQINATETLFT